MAEGKIQFFSEKTGKLYQLVPTKTIPALKINAVPMHRFVHIDPLEDARLKIEAAKPFGKVLDICTGLGYTAIQASKQVDVKEVITIEKDFEVLNMADMNPASRELFDNRKIKLIQGDATEAIRDFEKDSFDSIIHDPPTFVMAPELYHRDFYKELYRVLRKGCTLWHYAPEPGKSGSRGKNVKFLEGIIKRLGEAGFSGISHDRISCGIIGKK